MTRSTLGDFQRVTIDSPRTDEYSILLYNLNNNECDTLLTYPFTHYFHSPVFGDTENEVYFSWSGDLPSRPNGIYWIDITNNTFGPLTYEIYGFRIYYPFPNQIFIEKTEIMKLDVSTIELTSLVNGKYPDFSDNKMIYSTKNWSYDSKVRLLNLLTMENTLLDSHGFKPMFSNNGEKIVYIGVYITNPKSRNSPTN